MWHHIYDHIHGEGLKEAARGLNDECLRWQVGDGAQNAPRVFHNRVVFDARVTAVRRVCAISHSFRISVQEATPHSQIWPSVNTSHHKRDVFESAWEDLLQDSVNKDNNDPSD